MILAILDMRDQLKWAWQTRKASLAGRALAVLRRRIADKRKPDFTVGADAPGGAYLHRWFVIPRNRLFNVYLHRFMRSDDDRATHDHPWINLSIVLSGGYVEHEPLRRPDGTPDPYRTNKTWKRPGSISLRMPSSLHRVALPWTYGNCCTDLMPQEAWTIFITGPRVRKWGFLCPKGWISHDRFTKAGKPGEIGPGCEG